MTTLNNAFLRAYHRDRPATAAPPHASGSEPRMSSLPAPGAVHAAPPKAVQSPIAASQPHMHLAPTSATVPQHHANSVQPFVQGMEARTSLPFTHPGAYGATLSDVAPSAAYPPSASYHSAGNSGAYEPAAPHHRSPYAPAVPTSTPTQSPYAPHPASPSQLPGQPTFTSPAPPPHLPLGHAPTNYAPSNYAPPGHLPSSHVAPPLSPAIHPSTSVAPPHFLPPTPQARNTAVLPAVPLEPPATAEPSPPTAPQKTAPQRAAFAPAWEVDELPWTEACEQMKDCTGRALWRAVERWQSPHGVMPRVIGVTSLIRREGRSTVAASLARSAADSGRRVALLDADLDNPRLSASLETQIAAYWTDCVFQGASLDEAAVHSVSDHLTVFPLGAPDRQSPLDWSSPEILELFQSLRPHFDLIVLDLGPLTEVLRRGLQGGGDGPLDGTILLRDVRITGADQVLLIARELHQAGLPIVGVVDNFNETVAEEQP
jgi:Mrp family chromosome partitioning ATPase